MANNIPFRVAHAQKMSQLKARNLVILAELDEYAVWLRKGSDEEYEAAVTALELATDYAKAIGVVLI